MTKYVVGIFGSLLGALGGIWLILAPFALAYQPEDADWADPTFVDFWTGLPLLLVSVVGLAAFAGALFMELRSRGIIPPPSVPQQQGSPAGAQAPAQERSEMEQLLMPLVTAMLKDMQERDKDRNTENGEIPRSAGYSDARQVPTEGSERSVQR